MPVIYLCSSLLYNRTVIPLPLYRYTAVPTRAVAGGALLLSAVTSLSSQSYIRLSVREQTSVTELSDGVCQIACQTCQIA